MRKKLALLLSSLTFLTIHAYADAGIPMLALAWPGMMIALIPIIIVEAIVSNRIMKIDRKAIIIATSIANAVSTAVGVPLTWIVLVVIQISTGGGGIVYDFDTAIGKLLSVTWQAPWLLPFESDLYWMIPAAMLVLLIPFFFASWAIEFWTGLLVLRKRDIDRRKYRKAIFWANACSYCLLALLVAGDLAHSIISRG